MIAGNGVRVAQAKTELFAFARAIDAPVATTAGGKGVYPETDPSSLGVIGSFGRKAANEVVGGADLIVAVGTKLGPSDTANGNPHLIDPSRQAIIQIDVEPLNVSWTFPVDHSLIGDTGELLERLRIAYVNRPDVNRQRTAAERVVTANGPAEPEARDANLTVPLSPPHVIGALQDTIPSDAVVTADAGENRLFMMHWFRTPIAGDYLQPAGGGGMGYSIPAALGAKLAYPDRPVIAVCGDGGFSMMLHALMTAVHEDICIGVVVFNNDALGWSMHGSRANVGADFGHFDMASIASSIGCEAERVCAPHELRPLLERCVSAATRPFVLDVPTSTEISFRDVRTLRNYREPS